MDDETYIRRKEAAETLGVDPATLDRWVKAGRIMRADLARPGAWFARSEIDRFVVTPAS
jgi:predicted site-specific integrase-resolvase